MESIHTAIASAVSAAVPTMPSVPSLSEGLIPIRQEALINAIPSSILNSLTEEQKQELIKAGVLPGAEPTAK